MSVNFRSGLYDKLDRFQPDVGIPEECKPGEGRQVIFCFCLHFLLTVWLVSA